MGLLDHTPEGAALDMKVDPDYTESAMRLDTWWGKTSQAMLAKSQAFEHWHVYVVFEFAGEVAQFHLKG